MIFSYVIDNTEIFHHKRMLMFELHLERQNEEIYQKLLPNAHCCHLWFNGISLKESFSIQSSFHSPNHDPLIPCCDYNSDEKFVFSNETSQTSNTHQSSFYDSIYDWLEESILKKFLCHYFSFVIYCRYHDRIEAWLENFFHERFPVNISVLFSPMFDIDLEILIVSSCNLLFLHVTYCFFIYCF